MNRFHITPADLDQMTPIARVSSYQPDKTTWTELAVYYRDRHDRPWIGVVEGRTDALDMSNRFQAMAGGTLDRVMNWFEASNLRDRLAAQVGEVVGAADPVDVGRALAQQIEQRNRMAFLENLPPLADGDRHHAFEVERRGGRIPLMEPGERLDMVQIGDGQHALGDFTLSTKPAGEEDGFVPIITGKRKIGGTMRVVGITTDSFTEALKWLYPDAATDSARTVCLERDFGMPARTARRALAVEDGGVTGEPGAWVNMFLVCLRFFDRELWVAGGCSATIASVEG